MVPTLLARTSLLLIVNLATSIFTLLMAFLLVSTAGTVPYECFTQAGACEDNTSGLEGFELYVLLLWFGAEPVIGPRFARTRWRFCPGMTEKPFR
jgi:hypothetical protein